MFRLIFAASAGGLFGAGLLLSGMTNTAKVQGFLDLVGAWDPTLAFVMGGAILPMALAWVFVAKRSAQNLGPALGGTYPARTEQRFDGGLVLGSFMFGAGWALVGLCPGPALASLSFGGTSGWVFLAAMSAGMLAAPPVRRRLLPA